VQARRELDWRSHQQALSVGCVLSISPDAQSVSKLDLVGFDVATARKGGAPKERVLNALSLAQITRHLRARQASASPARKSAVAHAQRVAEAVL
jgi:DNA polymerase (family 10)